jgi:hypothetical protein
MKISIEHQGEDTQLKVSMEISDESTSDEVIGNFCNLLVAYGYHPESIKSSIIGKAEEDNEEKEAKDD